MLVSLLSRDRLDVNIIPARNQLYVQLAVLPVVYRILETGAILKNLMLLWKKHQA